MSEQIDRRGFFSTTKAKIIGGFGTGVVIAAAMANEVHNSDQGVRIEGPEGIFYPLYQRRQEYLLPPTLDAYVVLDSWRFTPEPYQFRKRRILAVPQLFIPPITDRDEIKENFNIALFESAMGLFYLAIKPSSKFLECAAAALAAWGISSSLQIVSMEAPRLELPQGAQRVKDRTTSIVSHLHPEQTLFIFNSLLGASRVLMVANYLKEQGIGQPQITYGAYELIVGMEDLLRKDREAINRLFARYALVNKKLFLNRLEGNSLEDFASMIIIHPNGSKEVITDNDLVKLLRFQLFGTNSSLPKSDNLNISSQLAAGGDGQLR